MKNLTLGLIIIFLIIGCKEQIVYNNDQSKQLYSLINDFLIDSLYKPDIISREVMLFNLDSNDSIALPSTMCSYSDMTYKTLLDSNLIDSTDLKLFKKQRMQRGQFELEPEKLKIKTFSRDSMYMLLHQDKNIRFWDYFPKKYNARSFMIISLPLFTKDNNTVLMTIDFSCGGLCGEGVIYVFKKVNGKWTICYRKMEWIS